jgi:hypothetical protein
MFGVIADQDSSRWFQIRREQKTRPARRCLANQATNSPRDQCDANKNGGIRKQVKLLGLECERSRRFRRRFNVVGRLLVRSICGWNIILVERTSLDNFPVDTRRRLHNLLWACTLFAHHRGANPVLTDNDTWAVLHHCCIAPSCVYRSVVDLPLTLH